MNTIEELIQKECPEGVEFKTLTDIALLKRGRVISKDYLRDNVGSYPVYSSQTANDGILGYIPTYDFDGEYLTWTTDGAYAGTIFYRKGKFSITNVCGLIDLFSDSVLLRFLYYWLSIEAVKYVYQGMGNPKLMSNQMAKIEIPVPPLSVQHKIVEILDKFTSLEAELEAELEARKKQYEYYRNQLLDFTGREDVERIVFNEICDVINGRAYKQSELLSSGKYRVLRVGNFFSNDSWYYSDLELEDKYYCQNGDLLYAWSASFGPHIWEEEKVIYHYHIWKLVCKEVVDKRFLFYWLQSNDMERQVSSEKHGATMAHLTKAMIEKLIVPLPSLEEQHRIVTILDKFEELINGQKASLSAEIKARHRQYEYYRDKLLSFKRKD